MLLAVARLERADRRFHTRMILFRGEKIFVCFSQLFYRLLCAGLRKTKARHNVGQLSLVVRRMEPAIKRQTTNPIVKALLQNLCLLNDHVFVALLARHQTVMNNETRCVFIHQNLTSNCTGSPALPRL